MPSHIDVAVIGLGRMGAAMASRISNAGHRLHLWNRDASKSQHVAASTGGRVHSTASEAAAAADVAISSLADDAALEDVYLGEGGIVQGLRGGELFVDTSTVDPQTSQRVGAELDTRDATFLDCPVSGSVSTVEAGSLIIMAGGAPEDIERARPALQPISSRIIHTGPRGSGAACKLAVNALVHGLNTALSEALVLAERAGVEREIAYEVFMTGAGGAPFVSYKRDAYLTPEAAPVAFSLNLVAKDLELITGLGARVGAPMSQAETGLSITRKAIDAGLGEHDLSAIAVYLRGST